MPERILVIDDDKGFCKTLVTVLKKKGYDAVGALDGTEAIDIVTNEANFDLIVSDIRLAGGMDGIEVLGQIKEKCGYPVKMILMTGFADKEAPIRAIELGVADYLFKPFQLEAFLFSVKKTIQVSQLEKDVDRYRELSNRDGLTNLYNHRYFHQIIQREIERSKRYNHPLSLCMIDIDNFKVINDNFGHLSGDIVLSKMSECFANAIRCVDLMFRYGGEEFTILLPETPKEEARNSAERLRKLIEDTHFNVLDNKKAALTISIGISEFSEDAKDKQAFIHCADQALFEAKRLGKNKVCIWEEDLPLRAEK